MRYTLLEIVQEILSAMESDEVDSIEDTVESNAVALLVKGVYFDMISEMDLPEHNTLFELNASGDITKPCQMTIPTNVMRLDWIKYDNKADADTNKDYQPVNYINFTEFLERQNALRNDTTGVGQQEFTQNGETFEVMYMDDRMPSYYTTTDENVLLFDAYDSDIDTTLQKSKTMCSGVVYPTWTMSDGFYPDLDPTQFAFLRNRAKVRAFAELKQIENAEAAGEARRQKIVTQKRKHKVDKGPAVFNVGARYGRK